MCSAIIQLPQLHCVHKTQEFYYSRKFTCHSYAAHTKPQYSSATSCNITQDQLCVRYSYECMPAYMSYMREYMRVHILKAFIKITKATRNSSGTAALKYFGKLVTATPTTIHIAIATSNNNNNGEKSEDAACCLTLEWFARNLAAAFLGAGCQRPSHVVLLITL